MTKGQAHILLDAARDGADFTAAEISFALRVLGDLDEIAIQYRSAPGEWRALPVGTRPATPFSGLLQ